MSLFPIDGRDSPEKLTSRRSAKRTLSKRAVAAIQSGRNMAARMGPEEGLELLSPPALIEVPKEVGKRLVYLAQLSRQERPGALQQLDAELMEMPVGTKVAVTMLDGVTNKLVILDGTERDYVYEQLYPGDIYGGFMVDTKSATQAETNRMIIRPGSIRYPGVYSTPKLSLKFWSQDEGGEDRIVHLPLPFDAAGEPLFAIDVTPPAGVLPPAQPL